MKLLKTLLLPAILLLFPLLSVAQEGKFGYLDFNGTMMLMSEYRDAEAKIQKLQSDYNEELERSKREFERKYIEFMLEQDHLSPSIVAKRQKELQLIMDNNAAFKQRILSELEQRREDFLDPLRKKLLLAVSQVCKQLELDYVIDTGTRTYLYINENKGVDISHQIYVQVGIEISKEEKAKIENARDLPSINK